MRGKNADVSGQGHVRKAVRILGGIPGRCWNRDLETNAHCHLNLHTSFIYTLAATSFEDPFAVEGITAGQCRV